MDTYTVCFFGHREIDNPLEVEEQLYDIVLHLLESKEYIEFLVGRNGEFDQLVSSTVRRVKRNYRDDNSALMLVLPYLTAEYENNHQSFHEYYDEIEICQDAAAHRFQPVFRGRLRAAWRRGRSSRHRGGPGRAAPRTSK